MLVLFQERISVGSRGNASFLLLFCCLNQYYFVVVECFGFSSACRLSLFDYCWLLVVVVLILVFFALKTGVHDMFANACSTALNQTSMENFQEAQVQARFRRPVDSTFLLQKRV